MKRRKFLLLMGGVIFSAALHVQAQERVRRIGVMMQIPENDPEAQARLLALKQGLEGFGWKLGQNVQLIYQAASDPREIPRHVSALLSSGPEVVLAVPSLNVMELQKQSPATPVIFINIGEPVRAGLVESITKPGRNTTGFTSIERSLPEKWVEILKELSPPLTRLLVLSNPSSTDQDLAKVMQKVGHAIGIEVAETVVRNSEDIERALDANAGTVNFGLIVQPGGPITVHRKWIIETAARNRWPAMYGFRYYAAEGGLVAYGASIVDQWHRAASYAHRILNGERAGDLPVQFPTKFELAINLQAARNLGLTIPPTLLARADEVIE
jgi:putative tryptophan/tyrosine transport system substrate-binding protein